jgi:hypothetical protein
VLRVSCKNAVQSIPLSSSYECEGCQRAGDSELGPSPVCRFLLQLAIKRRPTSGLEPLTCSLRVINRMLQEFARSCKSPISKPFSLLWLAQCCTVLRSRWCQSGVRSVCITRGALRRSTLSSFPRLPLVMLDRIPRRIANLRRMRQSMLGVIMPASADPSGRD